MENNWLDSRTAEMDLGAIMDHKQIISQQSDVVGKKTNLILGYMKAVPLRERR